MHCGRFVRPVSTLIVCFGFVSDGFAHYRTDDDVVVTKDADLRVRSESVTKFLRRDVLRVEKAFTTKGACEIRDGRLLPCLTPPNTFRPARPQSQPDTEQISLVLKQELVASSAESPGDDARAARTFTEVNRQWKQIDTQLGELINEFRNATEERRKTLRGDYETLAKRARKLQPRLEAAALDAYNQAPNQSEDVTGVLIGMAAAHLHQDNAQASAKITSLLLSKESDTEQLHQLAGTAAIVLHRFSDAKRLLTQAAARNELSARAQNDLDNIDALREHWRAERLLRLKQESADDLPRVRLETNKGDITLELFENEAPQTVGNFVHLVEQGFYDGLAFHRVLGNFMAQAGCPIGDGTGSAGYEIPCECQEEGYRRHFTASLSMAHAGRDTGSCQFFLTLRPTPHLDGKHTVFGMDVLTSLQRIDPKNSVAGIKPDRIVRASVIRKRDHEYRPTRVNQD